MAKKIIYKGSSLSALVSEMEGATTSAGKGGLVPAPSASDKDKFLAGDGTWKTPSASNVGTYTTTQIDNMISGVVSGLDWKEAVATYNDIATTYPNPVDGWTVNVKDTDYTYRYDGSAWVAISANAIPTATSSVNGLMSSTMYNKLDGIATGAEVNVKSNWNETDPDSDAFIQNKPTIPSVTGKADKVTDAVSGNFASLDSNGNLVDSGHKHSDYLTSHQSITGKADKVTDAVSGNFAGLDSNGNLTDSGKKASDFAVNTLVSKSANGLAPQLPNETTTTKFLRQDGTWAEPVTGGDTTGKADKVSGAISGNFAGLDSNGNLTDSGKKASDFATSSHNQASNTINAMTGYSKASSASDIEATDSLNTAIGKLEKTLEGKTSNAGTITGVTMNGASKGTSGVVDLGTVITSHQDISGKADKSSTVSSVSWDSTNKKLTKTINGATSDVVTGETILGELTSAQVITALGYTPPSSDTNTHRAINVNGTQALGDNTTALNLKQGDNITISASGGDVTISSTASGSVTGVKGSAETVYRTGDVNITPSNIGLGNVENKSSATIRSEITSANVTNALGYTPASSSSDYRRVFYGTCATAAATAAKVVSLSSSTGWERTYGTIVGVKFTYTNTASNPTLNVNSSGAYDIRYNGGYSPDAAIKQVAGWAGHIIYYMYDGSYWQYIGNDSLISCANGSGTGAIVGNDITNNTASGSYSHAEGYRTTASAGYSHAEGYYTTAAGSYSHVEGYYSVSNYSNQWVIGKNNNNKSDTVFEVGFGSSTSNRKNIFEIYSDGFISFDDGVTKVSGSNLASKPIILSKSVTLSISSSVSATFTSSALSESSASVDIYTDDPFITYDSASLNDTTLTVTFGPQIEAKTLNVKVYIYT